MLRNCLLAVTMAAALAATGAAQTAPKPLTNDDVVAMFKGGLDASTITGAIQSQDTNFNISATGLLQLKKSGLPPKIIDALVSAAGKHKQAAEAAAAAAAAKPASPPVISAAAPAVPSQPAVWVVQGGQKQPIPVAQTQIVQTKSKASTLGALASDGSLAQAMGSVTQSVAAAGMMKGSAKVASTAMMMNPLVGPAMMASSLFAAHRKQTITDVWAIAGPKSETLIHASQPAFAVHYDSMPGVNADDYEPVILRLEPTPSNVRLVGATEAKQDALQAPSADWGMYASFVEERVPAQATKVGAGSYQLQASAALAPGEYGIALRPVNKDKKFSGSTITQNTADGLLFNSVWSFTVVGGL
jgi:hypothetical protein